ncbi:hypothetical protein BP00DRAFT_430022 [Aspergillus indologenus CBS 114.80]|uniref:Uncharacterized protein n=1 Tax=Aspergillus indologenus CBS 114.80 TaxID=1450541 RepID=A0A2V5HSK3_9EURO|nr:hypothetical protein BP00DRAFT_430022 [Aspergillus indologenus CBS 114.80]
MIVVGDVVGVVMDVVMDAAGDAAGIAMITRMMMGVAAVRAFVSCGFGVLAVA